MVQQRELTRLSRRFEDDRFQAECIREALGKAGVNASISGKDANLGGVLPPLDNQVNRPCIEPALALLDQGFDRVRLECSRVLLSEFESCAISTTVLGSRSISVKPSPHSIRRNPISAQRSRY